MKTIYSYDKHDLFYIISPCAKMASDINLMFTLKRKLFLYVLQYLNNNCNLVCLVKLLHFIGGECVKASIMFCFSSLLLSCFNLITACI